MNNIVILIGRLTKEVELRYTEKELPIANFTIAINREYKNENGEYETDFINCVAFQQSAKLMGEYTHKGDLIGIKGKLQTRNYEDKEGKKHYVTEVITERITFLQQKKEENEFKDFKGKTEVKETVDYNESDLPW